MEPLLIKVEDVSSGEAWVYRRQESPVLLGRGEGAGLRIGRPFVSQAHGLFSYDEARACWTYADLDSASATALGERPLDPEEVVAVPPSTVLRVGPLALTVLDAASAGDAAEGSEAASPFAAGPATGDTARLPAVAAPPPPERPTQVIAGGTMLLPESFPRLPERLPPPPAPHPLAPARLRARAGPVAAVAVGVTLLSALVTWLLFRPTAAPRPPQPAAVKWEPPPATAIRPRSFEPLPEEAPPPPSPRQDHTAPAPRPRRRAHVTKPSQRGANGAFVLD